jgi:hypothetical protein
VAFLIQRRAILVLLGRFVKPKAVANPTYLPRGGVDSFQQALPGQVDCGGKLRLRKPAVENAFDETVEVEVE